MSKVQEVLNKNNITMLDAKDMCDIIDDLLDAYLEDERKKSSYRCDTVAEWKCCTKSLLDRFIDEYKEEKYFLVNIVEHYSKIVKVKAKDTKEAYDKVDKAWKENKIILNEDNYADGAIVMVTEVKNNDTTIYEELAE